MPLNKRHLCNMNTLVSSDIVMAARLLQQGQLVAIPTETVYGLAANATDTRAVKEIFRVKQRPAYNPLIVHVTGIDAMRPYVRYIPDAAEALIKAFSPGPITVLLPGNGVLPDVVNNGMPALAFRIPAHPVTHALLEMLPFPLVAPSANIFTTVSPTTPEHVKKNFDGAIPMILDGGDCGVGIESTVVGFNDNGIPVIYRKGTITADQIAAITGEVLENNHTTTLAAPGMLPNHYAPVTSLVLKNRSEMNIPEGVDVKQVAVLCFSKLLDNVPQHQQEILSPDASLAEAARNLYKALHRLDEMGLKLILAERLPDTGIGKAINDRLQRASAGRHIDTQP